MDDKQLVCIQCILEDNHKNHELNSMEVAWTMEMKSVEKYIHKAQQIQKKLESNVQSMQQMEQ